MAPILLSWTIIKSVWSLIVPYFMGRELLTVAPNAPGNFRPLFISGIAAVGLSNLI